MGVVRYLFITLAAFAGSLFAQPAITAIVNAGSGLVNASPGCMESIYGSNLAPSDADAPAGNLPTTLNGVTVTVGGIAAPIKYVSPGQINFQVPFEVTGGTASVIVTSGSSSPPFALGLSLTSPGLISVDPTHALIINSDFKPTATIQGRNIISLYAVGLGPTNPPTPSGAALNSQVPPNSVVDPPTLTIGGRQAQVLYAGTAQGFPGIYQINAVVPPMPLDNTIVLESLGVSSSNLVSFANGNVSNISGSANLLYPLATSTVIFSPVPVIANYSASFDIAANAQPFTIYAQSSAGSSTVFVNPSAGFFNISSTVPTDLERNGDFNTSGLTAIDLGDFRASNLPTPNFPGNVVPLSFFDPVLIAALQNVPEANSATPAIGMYASTGTAAPGTRFTIDMFSSSTAFAGFSSYTSVPSSQTISANVALYVDGMPIDSKSVTATTP